MTEQDGYFTRLSENLRLAREQILKSWETQVRANIDAAKQQDQIALRDHLPKFLERLVETLDPKKPVANAVEGTSIGKIHGRERAELRKYTITQILQEYRILRSVVFSNLERDQQLTREARDLILASFDSAARDAASAFVDEKFETEREHQAHTVRERDQSIELAERLKADNELQTKVVATFSHDLRNPIGAIKMALELLMLEVPLTADSQSLSELMLKNLDRTEIMLLDLLDVNRVRSGHKLPLTLETCNLTLFARGLLAEMTTLHGCKCNLEAKEEITGIWSPDRLRRMIENLLSNALKYGDAGQPITLSLSQNATHTTIAVHNTGKPVSKEDQATLFEPYYRSGTGESGMPMGWGLGLALVRAVADAHGGTAKVTSNAETGTTFTVVLPNDSTPFLD